MTKQESWPSFLKYVKTHSEIRALLKINRKNFSLFVEELCIFIHNIFQQENDDDDGEICLWFYTLTVGEFCNNTGVDEDMFDNLYECLDRELTKSNITVKLSSDYARISFMFKKDTPLLLTGHAIIGNGVLTVKPDYFPSGVEKFKLVKKCKVTIEEIEE